MKTIIYTLALILFFITSYFIWNHNTEIEDKLIQATNFRIEMRNKAITNGLELSKQLESQLISKEDSSADFKFGQINIEFDGGSQPDSTYLNELSSNLTTSFGKAKSLECGLLYNRNYWGDPGLPIVKGFNQRAVYRCKILNLKGEYRFYVHMVDSAGIKEYNMMLNNFAYYQNHQGFDSKKFIGVKYDCTNSKVRLICGGGGWWDWVDYPHIVGSLSKEKIQSEIKTPKRVKQQFSPILFKKSQNQSPINPAEFMNNEMKPAWCL